MNTNFEEAQRSLKATFMFKFQIYLPFVIKTKTFFFYVSLVKIQFLSFQFKKYSIMKP